MSNEQHPEWSREAFTTSSTPHPNGWPQNNVAPQSMPSQAATSQPPHFYATTGAPAQPQQATGTAFGQPEVATKTRKPKARLASFVAVALLAAGVGGGAGFAASQLPQTSQSAAVTTGDQTTGGGQTTTVVQGDPTNPDWATVAAAASKAVVAIQVANQSGAAEGSGVIIDAQGNIVTNNHVVSGLGSNAQITVLLNNTSYEAKIVGTDPSTDLAVIKIVDPPADLDVMKFGDSTKLVVGEPVMAIGNPLGLADTVTTGIVSALNRPVTTQAVTTEGSSGGRQNASSSTTVVTAAIQTNAAINPGNSGGALVNTSGELVGITSSIATLTSGNSESGNIGIGFAIGTDQVQYVVEQLIATGRAEHPQLGVSATDVTGTGQQGAVIAAVTADSAAASAGLQVGDLVTAVDGQPVSSTESLVALVRSGRVGEAMVLTVTRNGSEESVTVTPQAAAN